MHRRHLTASRANRRSRDLLVAAILWIVTLAAMAGGTAAVLALCVAELYVFAVAAAIATAVLYCVMQSAAIEASNRVSAARHTSTRSSVRKRVDDDRTMTLPAVVPASRIAR